MPKSFRMSLFILIGAGLLAGFLWLTFRTGAG